MPNNLSRQEERALRDMGREAMMKAVKAASGAAPTGVSRTFARVKAINSDGTLNVDIGSDSVPMLLTGIAKTTACSTVRTGDVVVLDTYAHVSVATGVIDVGQGLIPSGYITSAMIKDGAVGTADLANGSVTLAKAATDLLKECSPKSRSSVSTLNINYPGVFTWSPSSSNKPVADSYGVLMCFGNFGGTNSQWYMQLALPCSGNEVYVRRSINNGGSSWTSWVRLANQNDVSSIKNIMHPVGEMVFLQDGKTPNGQGFYGTWTRVAVNITCVGAGAKSLDVKDGLANEGQNVDIYSWNGTTAQKWRFYSTPEGTSASRTKFNAWVRTS